MALVLTALGKVKGRRIKTRQNKVIYAFKSIPYATPPVGDLRFSLPEPTEPWTGTLDCSAKESPSALQVNIMSPESKYLVGQEDCLYLNVFTPHLPGAGKRPIFAVIVWLHGGAFCVGSNDSRLYGPELLLDQGIVLVTVNYRLGPLGFLTLENDLAPGNLGLHDQVLALNWVQQHIASFGGDQSNITLMGESAGGMSCFLHLVSPLSRGLFQRMIVMSSSASTPFLHNDRKPSIYARAFAKELGANPEDTDENILDFLRSLPAKTIVEKTILFKDWDVTNPLPWKPNVDAYSSRPFLPKSFQELVQSGNFPKNIPILAGVNSEEGLILSAPFHKSPKRWNLLFQQWDTWAPQLFFNREADLVTESDRLCVAKIKDKYFNVAEDKKIPDCTDGNLRSLEQIFTTSIFHAPLARDLKLLVHEGVRVYSYLFSYQGSMTLVDIFRLPFMKMILNFSGRHMGAKLYQKKLGVCHGDDLFYLFPFNMSGFPNPLKTNSDRLTSSLMLSLWTNMAKFGNPNPLSQRDLGIIWEPLSPEGNELYLRIGSGLTLENDQALKSRVDHWNKLMEVNKFQTSSKKVPQIHAVIAEKRNLVMDPDQLFS